MVTARPKSLRRGVGETRPMTCARWLQMRPTASVSVAAENASDRDRMEARWLKSDDGLNPDLAAVEGACVARLLAFDCGIKRRRRRDAHQFIPVAGEAVGRDSDDELASGNLDDRAFLHARLGS